MGCHFLLQRIYPTQGGNLHSPLSPAWQEDSFPLSHLGSLLSYFICGNLLQQQEKPLYVSMASLVAQTVKNLPAMWETWVRSLGWEHSPGEGCGNSLQYSCLENPMDREVWWAMVQRLGKSWTLLRNWKASTKSRCLWGSASFGGPRGGSVPLRFQLLEVTCIPGLVAHSFIFKAYLSYFCSFLSFFFSLTLILLSPSFIHPCDYIELTRPSRIIPMSRSLITFVKHLPSCKIKHP